MGQNSQIGRTDPELQAALAQAADYNPEFARKLLARDADPNGAPLIIAIQSGGVQMVEVMVAAGADVNRGFAGPRH